MNILDLHLNFRQGCANYCQWFLSRWYGELPFCQLEISILTPEMDLFVDSEIQSGQYANASEVLRAGRRALEEDEQEIRLSYRPSARRFKLVSIAASRRRCHW
jgi:Arc/MetJ-type ribon-helix-helix transcriptional regulator